MVLGDTSTSLSGLDGVRVSTGALDGRRSIGRKHVTGAPWADKKNAVRYCQYKEMHRAETWGGVVSSRL